VLQIFRIPSFSLQRFWHFLPEPGSQPVTRERDVQILQIGKGPGSTDDDRNQSFQFGRAALSVLILCEAGSHHYYVRRRYCNLRFSELARDIKVSFGYDVTILVDYTCAKNEPSEHLGSGEMGIGANCVKIGICKKNCRLLAVFNMTLLECIFLFSL
jgi:hypothetical protein